MSRQRIRILNETTINQIAAGEVIEHPASVVKELIDNALDAGATEISVETRAGGRGLIKVVDNGWGMGQDDLLLSVERHATSKIVDVEGLNALKTLGFRGEALPSIASISKMTLHSALVSGEGYSVNIEGGKIGKLTPLPRCQGTTVEIKSLFYNVPVRKKFQKSIVSDVGEIHKTLTKFALCYSSLGFTWVNDGKGLMSFTRAEAGERRVSALLGEEFIAHALPVEHTQGSLSLQGWISRPSHHHPNRTGQYLFINQRAVTCPLIAQKVLEGYATRLPPHRYPLFVLHLTLPPSWIDVNVHPQKREVRIREEQQLSQFLLKAIAEAFPQNKSVPHAVIFPSEPMPAFTLSEPIPEYRTPQDEITLFAPKVKIIGSVRNYLFVEEGNAIRVVDVFRAMERVIFDELENPPDKQAIQALLLPIHLTVAGKEQTLLLEQLSLLNEKGISIRHFGGDAFIVDAIPTLLEPHEVPDLVHAFIEEGGVPRQIATCLKRKIPSPDIAAALIGKLFRCPNPDFTPSGKKIHSLLDEPTLKKLI